MASPTVTRRGRFGDGQVQGLVRGELAFEGVQRVKPQERLHNGGEGVVRGPKSGHVVGRAPQGAERT